LHDCGSNDVFHDAALSISIDILFRRTTVRRLKLMILPRAIEVQRFFRSEIVKIGALDSP